MSNRSVPNLEERLKHASEAKKLMLAKFKTSLVEGPATLEKRQQRQAIAAARAARAAQREEARLHQERDAAKQAELAAQAAADAERAAAEQATRDAAEQQNVMPCLRLNRRPPGMPVTRQGRQPRSYGGGATSPNFSHKGKSVLMLRSLGQTGFEIAQVPLGFRPDPQGPSLRSRKILWEITPKVGDNTGSELVQFQIVQSRHIVISCHISSRFAVSAIK